ncbi:MAG: AAA family ATPase [Candidatus Margulisbacteria bacterium]|nr:AAA family ATPase [Candidatus Margulisiibacteriota bacterium]
MAELLGYEFQNSISDTEHEKLFHGLQEDGQKKVIIKFLESPSGTKEANKLQYDFDVSQKLDVEGLLKPLNFVDQNNARAIIYDDFSGVSLRQLIKDKSLTLPQTISVAIQLANAIFGLHQSNVAHKEILPENILIDPKTKTLRLMNLSHSSPLDVETQSELHRLEGNIAYISPEQSGRTNHRIDYRTDFYSFGIVLYELLTRKVPFYSSDPLVIIHGHVAKLAAPPHTIDSAIPEGLSALVMHCLNKMPEDRYQSAQGLVFDLKECEKKFKKNKTFKPFKLGQKDVSSTFRIPQKLYGRDSEVNALTTVFDNVCKGNSEVLVIRGNSGVGKTSLVKELYKPVLENHGFFVSGKFEEHGQHIPHEPLIQSLKELVHQLLTLNDNRIVTWRKTLRKVLGNNGQVLTNVIPELEYIIGNQPPLQPLGPTESQYRFNRILMKFIRVFCRPTNPLVIFLDDIQWASEDAIKLLSHLMLDPSNKHLLLILTYRKSEVDKEHPLHRTLDHISANHKKVSHIKLEPLLTTDIEQLVSETLLLKEPDIKPLSTAIMDKTGGNPYFVHQFFYTLYEKGLVSFNGSRGHWEWDLEHISELGVQDNVVEFITRQIQSLSPQAQNVLKTMSCIGIQFSYRILTALYEKTQRDIKIGLPELIKKGYVIPLDSEEDDAPVWDNMSFRFSHDRVYHAAISLMLTPKKRLTHLKIGRLMIKQLSKEEREESILTIVNHLNEGRDYIATDLQQIELAKYNLKAGRKAKSILGYDQYLNYISIGMSMIPKELWQDYYNLGFALLMERFEAEFLTGHYLESDTYFQKIMAFCQDPTEQIKAYTLKIILLTYKGHYQEANELGRAGLEKMGVDFPIIPNHFAKSIQTTLILSRLLGKKIMNLQFQKEMSKPRLQVISSLYTALLPPLQQTSPDLYQWVVMKLINLYLKHGNTPSSSYAYMGLGVILCRDYNQYKRGYQLGLLALKLNSKYDNKQLNCKLKVDLGIFISPWLKHLQRSTRILRQAYQDGVNAGDSLYSNLALKGMIQQMVIQGNSIKNVLEETKTCAAITKQSQHQRTIHTHTLTEHFMMALQGLTHSTTNMSHGSFHEGEYIESLNGTQDKDTLIWYSLIKLQLSYLMYNYDQTAKIVNHIMETLDETKGQILQAEFMYYTVLSISVLFKTASIKKRFVYLKLMNRCRTSLKEWSKICPENFEHKYLLVEAEMANAFNQYNESERLYDKAADSALKNEYLQNAGIAYECALRHAIDRGKESDAIRYLEKSIKAYKQWGATGKLRQMEARYMDLWAKMKGQKPVTKDLRKEGMDQISVPSTLDMISVMKTVQAFSQEVDLNALLEKLIHTIIETAGAQRGALITKPEVGDLTVSAQGSVDTPKAEIVNSPLKDEAFPTSVIHYAIRSSEVVVIHNGIKDNRFNKDTYIQKQCPKSIMVVPIIKKNNTIGVLYLENNAVESAFTEKRETILKLIASQAAISLENSRLYSQLKEGNVLLQEEAKMRKQTEAELHTSRQKAESANRLKSQFLSNISHELRTPLNGILGLVKNISEGIDGPINPKVKKHLGMVENCGIQLKGMITNILDYTRMESGEFSYNMTSFNLRDVIEKVISEHENAAVEQGLRLYSDISKSKGNAYGDAKWMKQVLTNLLQNALKFTHEGEVVIRLKTIKDDNGVQWNEIRISDTGIGISSEHIDMIFDRFRQVEQDDTRSYDGAGLGLSICKYVIHSHGGDISVESDGQSGSTFILTIPIQKASNQ